jgi:hypothetical protein
MFEPNTYEQAMRCGSSAQWKEAMQTELLSHRENHTWDIVPLPKGARAIGSKWVFKVKTVNGTLDCHKARLVAQGNMQKTGKDVHGIFSPVASIETIRLVIVEAFMRDMRIEHMDVRTAYLYGLIDTEVYMKQPKGFLIRGKENHVCKLVKAIYGLRQSGKIWYETLRDFLLNTGFKQCWKDRCVFIKQTKEYTIIVIVYVDDLIIANNNDEARAEFKQALNKRFKMKDLGDLSYILGIRVTRTPNTLQFSQEHYTEEVLRRFGMWESNPKRTPMCPKKTAQADKSEPDTDFPYKEALGCLQYLARGTRPDIATFTSKAGTNQAHPKAADVQNIKGAMRYLKGHPDLCLTYYRQNEHPMFACCDATWRGEAKSRSRGGWMISRAGASVMWSSKVIRKPCDSSAESEYITASEATKPCTYYRELMSELGWNITEPTVLQVDNRSAIFMAQDATSQNRTRHIELKEMIISYQVEMNNLRTEHISTHENPSDHFTKMLTFEKFEKHRETIMGKPNNDQFNLSTRVVK